MKLLVGLLLYIPILLSQVPNPEWRNYTNGETIQSITEEGNFLWVGTQGGLVKLNKTTSQQEFYNKGNSILPSNFITSVAVDPDGWKWVSTYNGLVKFKDNDWYLYNTTNSGLPENKLLCITIDPSGNKWIGTLDSGLVKFDNTKWTIYNKSNSALTSNMIICLLLENNNLWIGTSSGLIRKTGNIFSQISDFQNNNITCLAKDLNGYFWIGTLSSLFRYNGTTIDRSFTIGYVSALTVDNHNVIWAAPNVIDPGYGGGIVNVDSAGNIITYNTSINNLLTYHYVSAISIDEFGTKWIGTGYGFYKFTDQGEKIFMSNSSLGNKEVKGLLIDKNNSKWFYLSEPTPLSGEPIPRGYLSLFDNNNWSIYNYKNSSVPYDGVFTVAESSQSGSIYVSAGYGIPSFLYRLLNGVWTNITLPQTQYNTIKFMWYDSLTELLWVDFLYSANKYTFLYNGSSWSQVNNIPGGAINKMKRRDNVIWIATSQGLIKYKDSVYTIFNNSNSGLLNNNVTSVDFDSHGNVWVSTGAGLAKYDGANWTTYNATNSPLTCDNLSSLAIDKTDNIYMGTVQTTSYPTISAIGLVKFDGKNWSIFNSTNSGLNDITYRSVLNSIYYYSLEDINDLAIDSTGKIWIASDGGVSVYDKDGIPTPVELLSFTGTQQNNSATLKWSTATETNNNGFYIQRSYNNGNWEEVVFIKGAGTSTQLHYYIFTDKNLLNGKYNYRLKQVDLNGTTSYSNQVELIISGRMDYALYQNYPNPFNPATTINYSIAKDGIVKLTIYNAIGSKVSTIVNEYKPAGSYSIQFNGSNFASGIYLYRLESGIYSSVKKLIIMK